MYATEQLEQIDRVFGEVDRDLLADIHGQLDHFAETMIGRYAGTPLDRLAHTLPVHLMSAKIGSDPDCAHVEIGTMFGGSVLAKLHVLDRLGSDHRVVAIDPLEGYYDRGPDPMTGLDVNEETFWANIEKFGLPAEQVDLVKCLSTEPTARQALEGRRVLTLLIDGDHSYEGVKADWEAFGPTVAGGGYVIFDDYKEGAWPGVNQFVNELLPVLPEDWRVLGEIDRAMIVQRCDA